MEIPIMVAPTAQAPFFTGTDVSRSIIRHRIKVIRRNVLAPLPNIAGHVVDAKLIRLLRCYVMSLRHRLTKPVETTHDPPGSPASYRLREQVMCTRPTRTIPGHVIDPVATAVNEFIFPAGAATSGVFPFSL